MSRPGSASLLDLDPELAEVLPEQVRLIARKRASVRVVEIPRGPWAHEPLQDPAAFGFFVMSGLVGARLAIGDEAYVEVLGEGDLLRPWVNLEPMASVPSNVRWRAFDQTRLAVLDGGFARAVAPWPELAAALMHRLVMRTRRVSFQLALAGIERVDQRLLVALWHFADRWGHVTSDGVVVRLALTHAHLGEIIRAARPSVSTAVSHLRRQGDLSVKRQSCEWILHREPPPIVEKLHKQVGLD